MHRLLTALRPSCCAAALSATLVAAVTVGVMAESSPAGAASAHDPRGALDSLVLKGSTASFAGWVADPDMSGTVRVVVSLDSTPVSSTLANQLRADVAKVYPKYGPRRGFSGSLALAAGKHTVCLTAGDLGVGSDTRLGCKTFTVPKIAGESTASAKSTKKPIGAFDWFYYSVGSHTLSVRGWALDPDTPKPIYVDLMVDGQSLGSAVAGVARPDVAKLYRLYGANHGFAYTMAAPVAPGNYQICAVAVNAGAGGNTILPCRVITIRPVGDPASLNVSTAATAAAAIQAQAIKSGAAKASNFPASANSASRIVIATRALLHQATGRGARPPAVKGLPAFTAAGPTKVVDEQAVMGTKPVLGTYPAVKKGGRSGVARSLQSYASDGWTPSGAAGVGILGAAAVLAANGKTVHPTLPAYPAGYVKLRAEVALDAALARIGDPYVWAAAGPTTFDCSGLTQWAWAKAGVNLTHYTGSQAVQGVRVQPNQLLPGDLVLFGSDKHHVGMYLGAGYLLDAPDTGAYVRVDKISWFGDFSLAVRP
ncbi:MAG: peptidoglycan DL-endopeptidase CwlO [Pseudonocardiales bacterium]|nr:peptidoglycan DL-endopeptidase CwlO [Pseudonocardiales bacterium]